MKFQVDGVEHEFDEERLTFGEGRALEKVTGYPFATIAEHGSELSVVQAWIWVALKREEPTLKFSDLDDRAITDFNFDEPADDEAPPNPTGAESPTSAPSTPNGSAGSATSLVSVAYAPGSSTG